MLAGAKVMGWNQHPPTLSLSKGLVLLLWAVQAILAQSPGASVRGSILDADAHPLSSATITANQRESGLTLQASADSRGEYSFEGLPLGRYDFVASKAGFQGLEKQAIELTVGQKFVLDFILYAAPTPGGKTAVNELLNHIPPAPALPVETIASSVSVVVDENQILQLPLASRNIYSLFLLQPGVTSQGAILTRGLSFAVHGLRPAISNYQLDGVDNNDMVLTGPLTPASAESIQEFRMTNSSFSSENGRATAFVAQVVSRSGSNRFHGDLYEFLSNDKLDANTFEHNSDGMAKSPLRQNQFGFSATGPVVQNTTFFSATLEASRLHYGTDQSLLLPTPFYIAGLPHDSIARQLLTEFPPIASTPTADDPNTGLAQIQAPSRIDTLLASGRLDRNFAAGKDRLLLRYALASTDEQHGEDATGYPALLPTDRFRSYNTLLGWAHSFQAGQVNEFRVGWSRERIWLPRPYPDIPIVQLESPIVLPGSKSQADQRENNNLIQFSDLFSLRRGRSSLSLGFETRKSFENGITLGLENETLGGVPRFANGWYLFQDLNSFAQGQPIGFEMAVDRSSSGHLQLPDLRRSYRSSDYSAYFQDDVKLSRHLSVNLGLRYENFGVLHNTDRSKDVNFVFGPGSTIEERLANGTLRSTDQNPGDLHGLLYHPSSLDLAPSIGLAWDPFGKARTVLRAGYALAFDRVFDTLRDLRSNNEAAAACIIYLGCIPSSLLIPAVRMLPLLSQTIQPDVVVQLDQNLRTPYAQNWYFGIQQSVTPNFLVEVGHVGAVGRKLISRDDVNRSIGGTALNSQILDDTFVSSAGNSNYLGLEVSLRRRFSRGLQYQVSYTFSHAIDNQSDNFQGVRIGPNPPDFELATFTRQFDARVDRGNANFDQRHNLVFNAIWDVPAPLLSATWANQFLRGWTTSVIGAYRSGFPLTVICTDFSCEEFGFQNNRADFLGRPGRSLTPSSPQPVAGGVQLLDPNLFQPAIDHVGTLGRGAFAGPGFWNYDFALLRSFTLREGSLRIQFRAEFYNLFNHANLSVPVTDISASNFGQAFYGLSRTFSRFGELPLDNPARRIQFGIRIQF
jgi:hypothetical protein